MKALSTLLAVVLTIGVGYAQDIERALDPFDKIVVSHKIDLVLIPGNEESIRIEYHGVDPDKIVIDQRNGKVKVYLEDAKWFDIGERRDGMFDRRERYRHAVVTAYVTFKRELKMINIRGEGNVTCDEKIVSKKLTIKAYGENKLSFAYLEAKTVKTKLFGSNKMRVLEGDAGHLNYKMWGENLIDSRGLSSVTSNTTIYGEGRVALYATEEVHVNSFGEPSLLISGSPVISKGIVIGTANIRRN